LRQKQEHRKDGAPSLGAHGAGFDLAELGAEVTSASSRAQYAAMVALRWHIFVNGLRSRMGFFELGARTVTYFIFGVFGLGLGLMAGEGAYLLASGGMWLFLPSIFWALCLLWQGGPVMLASLQEQFDLGILLRFPVRFSSYYLLYVVFGLADISTILGAVCCLGIWIGVTAARPELFAWTALSLIGFAAFNVLLVRAIFAWIDRWLTQRKTREIVGALFMVLLLSLQLLNPALHQKRHSYPSRTVTPEQARELINESEQQKVEFRVRYEPWLKNADAVQQWLPPGLVARGLREAAGGQTGQALLSLGVLGVWTLAAGGVLARRLRAEYRGENLSSAPSLSKAAETLPSSLPVEAGWRFGGSNPLIPLMEKEARALRRTLPLLWALGAPIFMILLMASLFRGNPAGMGGSFVFALPLYLAFVLMSFTQLFSNNLGAEGAGIQLLFLSPTPIRTVFLAKNLFHGLLFCVDALLVGSLAILRLGWPAREIAAATAAWALFALPCCLAVGNILSLRMPFRIHPGKMTRQRGSQANALCSMALLLAVMGVGAGIFWLGWALEARWLAVLLLLLGAAGAIRIWLRGLRGVDALANQRRDTLLAALMKTE
jgi:ABC-2 type transport system permease protein